MPPINRPFHPSQQKAQSSRQPDPTPRRPAAPSSYSGFFSQRSSRELQSEVTPEEDPVASLVLPTWSRPPSFIDRLAEALIAAQKQHQAKMPPPLTASLRALRAQAAEPARTPDEVVAMIKLYLKADRIDLLEDLIIMRANSAALEMRPAQYRSSIPQELEGQVMPRLTDRLANTGWSRTMEAFSKAGFSPAALSDPDFIKLACELLARELPGCVENRELVGTLWRFADLVMSVVMSTEPTAGPGPKGSPLWVADFVAATLRRGIAGWDEVKNSGALKFKAAERKVGHVFDVLLHNEDRTQRILPLELQFVRAEYRRWQELLQRAQEGNRTVRPQEV